MNKEIRDIRWQLEEIAEHEAMKVFRMAKRLQDHGGTPEKVREIRNEAFELLDSRSPEKLINPFKRWKYAFKQ